jgi:hypothetical protein
MNIGKQLDRFGGIRESVNTDSIPEPEFFCNDLEAVYYELITGRQSSNPVIPNMLNCVRDYSEHYRMSRYISFDIREC